MHPVLSVMVLAMRIPCIDLLDATPSMPIATGFERTATQFLPTELFRRGLSSFRIRRWSSPKMGGIQEQSTYEVRYGFLGAIGELHISAGGISKGQDGIPVMEIRGSGAGEVFGLGRFERTVETEFNLQTQWSRKWRTVRRSDGGSGHSIADSVNRQPNDALIIERRKDGAPAPSSVETLLAGGTTSDPLGLIWRLRNQTFTPGQTLTLQMLDGVALWRIEARVLGDAAPVPDSVRRAIHLQATLTPILYDGQRDNLRPDRQFTLWLDAAPGHLPLRLQMPIGPADAILILKESHGNVPGSVLPRS